MTSPKFDRPGKDEYQPYYETYVAKVPAADLVGGLTAQIGEVMTLLRPLTDDQARSAYAPGKWTIKEVVGHLIDTERVMSYRAMSFARGDATPLPGFDEKAWTPAGQFNQRALGGLIDEWVAVRSATIAFFSGLPVDSVGRRGLANGNEVSVRGLAYIISGHTLHHAGILKERYLTPAP